MADTLNWDGLVNATSVSGSGIITKDGSGTLFDSGGQSIATLPGAGWVQFTNPVSAGPVKAFGLSASPSPGSDYSNIEFGIIVDTGKVWITESGSLTSVSAAAPAAGDVWRVAVEAGPSIAYYKNGALYYSSGGTPTLPLYAESSISTPGASLTVCEIYGHQRSVQFTDTSTTDTTSWLWLFGDGTTSTDQNPTHTFTLDGTYSVTLLATSAKGTSSYMGAVVILNGLLESFTPSQLVPTPGGDPQVMLRISNDGGKTWVAETWRDAGKVGEYLRRVRWNRLGAARRRVFEIAVTDPIQWKITGAYIETEPGDA